MSKFSADFHENWSFSTISALSGSYEISLRAYAARIIPHLRKISYRDAARKSAIRASCSTKFPVKDRVRHAVDRVEEPLVAIDQGRKEER